MSEAPDYVTLDEFRARTAGWWAVGDVSRAIAQRPWEQPPLPKYEAVFDLQSNGYLIVRDDEVVAWEPRPTDPPVEMSVEDLAAFLGHELPPAEQPSGPHSSRQGRL